jgi:hypothetical protein
VYTVVLTGGPCGGKSTALATLTKHLRAQGYEVYSVPEIPTLVFTGVSPIYARACRVCAVCVVCVVCVVWRDRLTACRA